MSKWNLPYHKILWFDSSPDGRFVHLCGLQMCRFECAMVNPVKIKKKWVKSKSIAILCEENWFFAILLKNQQDNSLLKNSTKNIE